MTRIGFGRQTSHPRPGIAMIDDHILGDLRADPVDATFDRLSVLADRSSSDGHDFRSAIDRQGAAVSSIALSSSPKMSFLVTHSAMGWVVDVFDSFKSARSAQSAHGAEGAGGLWLQGSYSTDGQMAWRGQLQVPCPGFARAGDLEHVDGVKDWLEQSPQSNANAVVALLLPELAASALLSYEVLASMTGLKAQTLRNYMSRGEGSQIPWRQASTPQGLAQWSRPVIEEWIAIRDDPTRRCPTFRVVCDSTAEIATGLTEEEAHALVEDQRQTTPRPRLRVVADRQRDASIGPPELVQIRQPTLLAPNCNKADCGWPFP